MKTFDNIRYIGVDDDDIDLFESLYPMTGGISYNSYFIDDTHPAIVDAVDKRRCDDWLINISQVLDGSGRKPEYIIVQHAEPDHTGSLKALIKRFPDIRIVCTPKAGVMLDAFFEDVDIQSRLVTVADGDTMSLGHTQLRFVTAPMVHWPEVMMTYDETDSLLFSADAFGTFALWNSATGWDAEARRYYANIVGRYGSSVQAVMKKLDKIAVNAIAPLHGPLITDTIAHCVELYDKWSRYEPESDGVLVAYASIYGGTSDAARRLGVMLRAAGVEDVVPFDLCRHDVSYAVAEAFRVRRMVLACATYDGDLFPPMHSFLHHLASKRLTGRTVGLIENGAWAPVAARLMAEKLSQMRGNTVVKPLVSISGRLHRSDLPALGALAKALTDPSQFEAAE